ncbi:hypothetical protein R3P38DRAFT_2804533 [Favolaschia claudopus]|uniref:Uncharacterized protein n=1 Tax=Favolaschia claudopus TaxID=2862362 RepID=A0AAV9ZQS0_9AGAR
MTDPTQCRGLEKDGTQCPCLRVDETYTDDDGSLRCRSCKHIVSAHPAPPKANTLEDLGDYVRSFQSAGKNSGTGNQPLKASREEATSETTEGLGKSSSSKKRKTETSEAERPKKKANKGKGKAKEEEADGEDMEFGKLVLLPYGITAEGNMRKSSFPTNTVQETMERSELIVQPPKLMKINSGWSRQQLQQRLEVYLPNAMHYLGKNPGYPGRADDPADVQNQSWLPVVKKNSTLTLQTNPLPTALQLVNILKGQQGRAKSVRTLVLVSKPKIPQSAWTWEESKEEDGSDAEAVLDPSADDALDELASDLDTLPSEDIIHAPSTSTSSETKKKVFIKKEKGEGAKIVVKEEEEVEVESDQESDMRQAARRRTRLGTGAITYNKGRRDSDSGCRRRDDLRAVIKEVSKGVVDSTDAEYKRCDDVGLDGKPRDPNTTADSYNHAQKMRAACTYGYGRLHGLGSVPWQKSPQWRGSNKRSRNHSG